ncbi:hypothetical protein AVEN_245027-1 [Araneus ventricosus]|uniref:Uncharacterized protein n=1 Tax=Araneus ventricosus TaxID=182803 RepID=A0A4Y2E9T4_ARAVE|nr:hypothetical protein AVEN_245027-1 [Araneus ventricosus]
MSGAPSLPHLPKSRQYHPIPENRQSPAASLILLANLSFPTLRKALEMLLTQRLTYHMESCNITSRNQHVFLEGRYTFSHQLNCRCKKTKQTCTGAVK